MSSTNKYLFEKYTTNNIGIENAIYVNGYQIKIRFSDGKLSIVDFKNFLQGNNHPEIKKYRDIDLFKDFKIIDGNLNWHDHKLIFPISDLYNGKI